jgi:hypothetical protein
VVDIQRFTFEIQDLRDLHNKMMVGLIALLYILYLGDSILHLLDRGAEKFKVIFVFQIIITGLISAMNGLLLIIGPNHPVPPVVRLAIYGTRVTCPTVILNIVLAKLWPGYPKHLFSRVKNWPLETSNETLFPDLEYRYRDYLNQWTSEILRRRRHDHWPLLRLPLAQVR